MMKPFVWSNKYSVHVAAIDEQHQEFFHICNDILALANGDGFTVDEAMKQVARLGDYAFYHLGYEEDLFLETHYPDAPAHIEAHNRFRAKAKAFMDSARGGHLTPESAKEIVDFTTEWLLGHILYTDKLYSDHFNAHGIK